MLPNPIDPRATTADPPVMAPVAPAAVSETLASRTEGSLKPASVHQQEKQVALARLKAEVDAANEKLKQQGGYNMRFEIHKGTREVIVRLIDRETEKVLREFPSEKYLDTVAKLLETAGLRIDAQR